MAIIENGLKDVDENTEANINYSIPKTSMTISNFEAVDSQTSISILLQIECPTTSGKTNPLDIKTYRPDGKTVIDEQTTGAYTTVATIISPDVVVNFPGSNQATGLTVNINFLITPNINIPASGFISFKIPSGFGTSGVVCKLTPYNVGQDFATTCTISGDILRIQLFATTTNAPAGSGAFPIAVQSVVSLTLIAPNVAGYYFFDIITYDSSNTLLESANIIVTLTAPSFASLTVSAIHFANNYPTIMIVTCTTAFDVPAGIVEFEFTDKRGYFEITFPTQVSGVDRFPLDLGLGINENETFPCRGITGITGENDDGLVCKLTSKPTVASAGTPVIITVMGFRSISSGSAFTLHIPNVYYVKTTNTASVTFTSYYKKNRVRTDIQTRTITVTAANIGPSSVTTATALSSSDTKVQSTTTLTSASITVSGATGLASPYFLLHITPTHDKGYCGYAYISCLFDGNSQICYCYPGTDMILVVLSSALTNGGHTFSVSGLVNPQSSGTVDGFNLYAVENGIVRNAFSYSAKMPAITPGSITDYRAVSDDGLAGQPNAVYTMVFTTAHEIPENGIAEFIFPAGYPTLHYLSPLPSCSVIFIANLDTKELSCTPYGNTITINDLPYSPAQTFVKAVVQGIKNPSSTGSVGNFIFRIKNLEFGVIDEISTVIGPRLTSSWKTKDINDIKILNFPSNAGATAEYIFSFDVLSRLGTGGTIEIDFPTKDFGMLTNPPDCRATGAISSLSGCFINGRTLIATVAKNVGGSTNIHVFGILNFSEGSSDLFKLRTYYDGVLIQQAANSPVATTTTKAKSLAISGISMYPKNEGEEATYEFEIIPSEDINTDEFIIITFPRVYDQRLGDNLDCWATGINGFIKCSLYDA